MKALKTIVATAVIVFALTTVAVAGARHVGNWGDASTPTAGLAATGTHHGGMTLSDDQFARLLQAVNGQAAKLHAPHADRETIREHDRDHSLHKAGGSAGHVQAQHRTKSQRVTGGTHDGDGTRNAGTQHDGGTHHDGGTCDAGTHHDAGTCDD
jgi:hypothetical protein